ncbi:MAG: histidinol-phosphate transaminase [Anaerolineae bacterium]|nr:histidinol-phosphate aminotransferase family protein [Anaerolineae bacterium]MDW8099255.1 histidinol-phosphate transaminase [Anaerolineae bacterium]
MNSVFASEPHGGPDYGELAALGLRPEDVLDFSTNTNAFGPPPGVLAALAACDVTRYPDRHASPLREALAARDGVPTDWVLVGAGATGLIWALALAWLQPGDTTFIVGPTFSEYAVASRLVQAEIEEWRGLWPVTMEYRFSSAANEHDEPKRRQSAAIQELAQAIAAARPRLVWLCNPNNPTGTYLTAGEIAALLPAATNALWVLDEAYRPFVIEPWPSVLLLGSGHVVLLRSLTKEWALPGVRLGYLLAPPDVVARVAASQPPWSVSAAAIACGLAALRDPDHVARTTAILRAEAVRLADRLRAQGWRVLPSATHFMLIEVGDAAAVRAALLREHHIQVRNCTSFGLPAFIRVAARRPEENERLIEAMSGIKVSDTCQAPGM